MKKFLLSALLIGAGVAAQAEDLYVIGDNVDGEGWALGTNKMTDNGDGTYTWSGSVLSGFKINDGTWDGTNIGAGQEGELEIGVPFTVVNDGLSGNIVIAKYQYIVDPVVTLNMNAMTVTVNGTPGPEKAEADDNIIYLVGDMQGWDINGDSYPLGKTAEGVYEATYTFADGLDNCYFRFYTVLGNWDSDSYGPLPDDNTNTEVEFEDGVYTYELVSGKGSWVLPSLDAGESIHFKVDFNDMEVEFTTGSALDGVATVGAELNGEEVIYNLQGVRVAKAATPGIYIVNGKKTVIR